MDGSSTGLSGHALLVSKEAVLLGDIAGCLLRQQRRLVHVSRSSPSKLAQACSHGTWECSKKECKCLRLLKAQARIHMSLLPHSLANTRH